MAVFIPREFIVLGLVALVTGLVVPVVRRWRRKRVLSARIEQIRTSLPPDSFSISGKAQSRFRRWTIPDKKGRGYYHTLR